MRNLLLALALLCLALPAAARDYVQLPDSKLTFAGKYQGALFVGSFPGFVTRLRFDPRDVESARLEVTIPLAGAATGTRDYDSELRGPSFFDAARFPQAHYVATAFRDLGQGRYAADGTLTLRGVSKPVTLVFTWTPGAQPILFGSASVSRLAFGVGGGDWADTVLIPDMIAVAARVRLRPTDD